MNIIHIKTYKEFKKHFGGFPRSDNGYFYRGVRAEFPLVPSMCYSDLVNKIKDFPKYERHLIRAFAKVLSIFYRIRDVNDWNLWFMARHFGLKSRLMDFSKDDTVAFQFAFNDSAGKSVRIYCLNKAAFGGACQEEHLKRSGYTPFTHNKLDLIHPTSTYSNIDLENLGVSRIVIQSGFFLYQPIDTIHIPVTKQIPDKYWLVFEIACADIAAFKNEIEKSAGVDMDSYLLKRRHGLDKICKFLNRLFTFRIFKP